MEILDKEMYGIPVLLEHIGRLRNQKSGYRCIQNLKSKI
jgi:hypothetical protein